MGRWMEVLRAQPEDGQRGHDESYEKLVVGEIAPHPLMHAFDQLCRANPGKREIIRKHFPMLEAVGLNSDRYVDEDLWLDAAEASRLIEELQKLRRICQREEFIASLDGPATYAAWRGSERREDFDESLDRIEALLGKAAASGYAVRLML
jgi:hypothetical protein